MPVKYLEFYSFACHVIEIFTFFCFRRDKYSDTAWQTWMMERENSINNINNNNMCMKFKLRGILSKSNGCELNFFLCLLRKAEKICDIFGRERRIQPWWFLKWIFIPRRIFVEFVFESTLLELHIISSGGLNITLGFVWIQME